MSTLTTGGATIDPGGAIAMKRNRVFESSLCAVCVAMASAVAVADPIYKHVDSQGRVTYSSTPPKGGGTVEKLQVPDQPSASEVAAARRQLEGEKQQVKSYEGERRKREEEEAKLRREQLARERDAAAAQPPVATDDSGTVFYPGWGYRPPLRPVSPWPRPDPRPPATLPATPQPPLMAPPKRPIPQPQ